MALVLKSQNPSSISPSIFPTRIANVFTIDDFRFNNISNILGVADGTEASASVRYIDAQNDWTDSYWLLFDLPSYMDTALVEGFKYTLKQCRVVGNSSYQAAYEVSVLTAAHQRIGCSEIYTGDATTWPTQSVKTDIGSNLPVSTFYKGGPDNITLFSGGANRFSGWLVNEIDLKGVVHVGSEVYGTDNNGHLGTGMATFADFGGITFRTRAIGSVPSAYFDTYIDAIEMDFYYTPATLGDSEKTLTPSAITTATLGSIAFGTPDGYTECAWSNISNISGNDTTIATCGVGDCTEMLSAPAGSTATDTLGITRFVKLSYPTGSLTNALTYNIQELRVNWRGRAECQDYVDVAGTRTGPDYINVYDVVIKNASSGATLAQLSTNDQYNTRAFRVGSFNFTPSPYNATTLRRGERDRAISINLTGLTTAQLTAMNVDGFDVYVSWILDNTNNLADGSTNTYCAIALNSVICTLGCSSSKNAESTISTWLDVQKSFPIFPAAYATTSSTNDITWANAPLPCLLAGYEVITHINAMLEYQGAGWTDAILNSNLDQYLTLIKVWIANRTPMDARETRQPTVSTVNLVNSTRDTDGSDGYSSVAPYAPNLPNLNNDRLKYGIQWLKYLVNTLAEAGSGSSITVPWVRSLLCQYVNELVNRSPAN